MAWLDALHILAKKLNRAREWLQERCCGFKQGTFSAAVGTDKRDKLPLFHPEADAVEHPSLLVSSGNIVEGQGILFHSYAIHACCILR